MEKRLWIVGRGRTMGGVVAHHHEKEAFESGVRILNVVGPRSRWKSETPLPVEAVRRVQQPVQKQLNEEKGEKEEEEWTSVGITVEQKFCLLRLSALLDFTECSTVPAISSRV